MWVLITWNVVLLILLICPEIRVSLGTTLIKLKNNWEIEDLSVVHMSRMCSIRAHKRGNALYVLRETALRVLSIHCTWQCGTVYCTAIGMRCWTKIGVFRGRKKLEYGVHVPHIRLECGILVLQERKRDAVRSVLVPQRPWSSNRVNGLVARHFFCPLGTLYSDQKNGWLPWCYQNNGW